MSSIAQVSYSPNAAAAAKSLQLCPTLCDPIDGSPPGSPVPGILKARTLEWVDISFSNAWKWKVKVKSLSRVRLFVTPWTAAYQAPPSMGFSMQEYWSGVPLPSPLWRLVGFNLLLQELQNYNLLLNNYQQENVGAHQKKIPHIQGQCRSPSKMVGGAKSHLELNPIPARDAWRAQTKTCAHQDPETPLLSQTYLNLLWRYGSAVASYRDRGSGCSYLSHRACGISPLGGGCH